MTQQAWLEELLRRIRGRKRVRLYVPVTNCYAWVIPLSANA